EKPYKCLDCGKSFTRSSNRNAHQRLHGGARPFPCSDRGKNFGQSPDPSEHRRPHANRRPHPCPECGKSLGWSSEPGVHQGVPQGGERPPPPPPHQCSQCSHLRGQRRTQLGQRPYACGDCGKSFSYSSAFLKH
ncbi:ZSCA2 protein, partial [Uria aalge]|nr:ZSCA2 protein [Uria aalge]